jgi:hypothetical protein
VKSLGSSVIVLVQKWNPWLLPYCPCNGHTMLFTPG